MGMASSCQWVKSPASMTLIAAGALKRNVCLASTCLAIANCAFPNSGFSSYRLTKEPLLPYAGATPEFLERATRNALPNRFYCYLRLATKSIQNRVVVQFGAHLDARVPKGQKKIAHRFIGG